MSDRYDREFHTAHLYVPGPLGDATLPCMARAVTALPLRDFTDAERAKLDAIEAAPAAEEAVRERVARAMWEANNPALAEIYSPDKVAELWAGGHGTPSGDRYREQADAALAVLSGPSSDAERAVERVLDEAAMTDEEADAADVCAANYRRMGCDADYARCASLADQARTIADRIRAAIAGPTC